MGLNHFHLSFGVKHNRTVFVLCDQSAPLEFGAIQRTAGDSTLGSDEAAGRDDCR